MALPSRIGFIGVGAIGSRLALRAKSAGAEASAYDVNPVALGPLGEKGILVLGSPAEVAATCDVIVTCVTDPRAVEAALLGPAGVVEAARAGTLVIETTTSTPAVTRRIAAQLARHGVRLVDAPVSRGVPAAENGTLSIMAGGDRADVDRALSVLHLFGTDIIQTGGLGSGHIAKALNMSVLGVNFLACAEIMALGLGVGLARATLAEAIDRSDAASFVSGHHYPKYVLPGRFESRFTLELMKKDVGIASSIAADTGLFRPFTTRVTDFYDRVPRRNLSDDNTRLFPQIEQRAGLSLERQAHGAPALSHPELIDALAATILLGTQEGLAIAASAGVQPEIFSQVLRVSSGASQMLEHAVSGGATPWGRKAAAVNASLVAIMRAALSHTIPMPVVGLARDLVAEAINRGLASMDATAIWPSLMADPA